LAGDPIVLAAVAGAHGIGGEVRLKLFTEDLANLTKASLAAAGRSYQVASFRAAAQGAIARIDGVTTRNEAEALRGGLLTVPRDVLPPLGEGEYYWADLIGLPCVSADGEPLGIVVAIDNYGAGDILEIERADGARVLVPFREPAAVLDGERLIVDPDFLA